MKKLLKFIKLIIMFFVILALLYLVVDSYEKHLVAPSKPRTYIGYDYQNNNSKSDKWKIDCETENVYCD